MTDDPLLENPSDLPTGFTGAFGIDIKPNSDGLNITADSPARDGGAALDLAYNSSINSVTRPQLAGWDIGAYEFAPGLDLHGAPGAQAIYLDWVVNVSLPATTTWHIDYYTTTLTTPFTATDSLSTTRSYVLTQNVDNYQWYTATLHAMVGETTWMSDTVRVMPTDILAHLPLVMREA